MIISQFPPTVTPEINKYLLAEKEWKSSGISQELIDTNLVVLEGDKACDFMFDYSNISRLNNGRLSSADLRKYYRYSEGFWYCKSFDPQTGGEMSWAQIKPFKPATYFDREKGKEQTIKYESPTGQKARVIIPLVPTVTGEQILNSYGVTSSGKGFWFDVINNPQIPIEITEGAKKALALISQGKIAIALPGITMGLRRENDLKKIHPDLLPFCQEERQINIVFDQDPKPKTRLNVSKAIFSLCSLLQWEKVKTRVVQWDYKLGKGIDDVLAATDSDKVNFIKETWENSLSFNLWSNNYLFSLRQPNLTCNSRFLSDSISTLPDERLIGLKSPQNTGKTEVIKKEVQKSINKGIPVIVITHLESLAKATANRFDISYRTDFEVSGNITRLKKTYEGFSLCVDSFYPKDTGFNPDNYDEITLIIDECDQVLDHLLKGKTDVQKHRPEIIKTLFEIAPKVNKCILADADLSDVTVEYFESLLGEKAYIIENEFKFTMNFWGYNHPSNVIEAICNDLADNNKPVYICTSAQKASSKYGTITLESYFKKKHPDKRIIRIDSETLEDPDHPAFRKLANLNQFLVGYDIVIVSPSVSTGVSIDIYDYFSCVYGINQGNISPQTFLQMLWRVRDTKIERRFFIAHSGFGYCGNGSNSPQRLLQSNKDKILTNLAFLDSSLSVFDDETNPINLQTWAKLSARQNASNRCARELFAHLVKQQGHYFGIFNCTKRKFRDEGVKETRDEELLKEDCEVLEAVEIDGDKKEKIENQRIAKGLTKRDRRAIQKYDLKAKYGIDLSLDLFAFDRDKGYSKAQLYFYLTVGKIFLKDRDKRIAKSVADNGTQKGFSFDLNARLLAPMVKVFERLGITDLIAYLEDKETVTGHDEILLEMNDLILKKYKKIFQTLGLTVSKKPLITINGLLDRLGYSLKSLKVVKKNGDSVRQYELVKPPEFLPQIFDYFLDNEKRHNQDSEGGVAVTRYV